MDCTILQEQVLLDNQGVYSTESLGNVSISITKIVGAKNYVEWTNYQPSLEFVPLHRTAADISGLAGFISTILIALSFIGYYLQRLNDRKTPLILSIEAVYLIKTIGYMYNVYGYIPTEDAMLTLAIIIYVGSFNNCLRNLASANILSQLLNLSSSLKLSMYAVFVLLYIVRFVANVLVITDQVVAQPFMDLLDISHFSHTYGNVYSGIACCFDLVPIIFMLCKILYQFKFNESKKGIAMSRSQLLWKYKTGFFLIFLQVAGSIAYGILYYIYSITNMLGSDDAILGLEGAFSLFEQLQISGTLLLYAYLRHFTEELIKPKTNRMYVGASDKTIAEQTLKMTALKQTTIE
ncbi:hypothetical protein HDV01_001636 [Terramyces sp. JEL0728]|nr:hypothetical protein HDV01_001636 [Terramyces sp. JEL0728]